MRAATTTIALGSLSPHSVNVVKLVEFIICVRINVAAAAFGGSSSVASIHDCAVEEALLACLARLLFALSNGG